MHVCCIFDGITCGTFKKFIDLKTRHFSEVSFPSLSSVIEESNLRGYDDGGKFEEVKERGGQQYQAGQQDI